MGKVVLIDNYLWLRLTRHLVNVVKKCVHLLGLKRILEQFWIFTILDQNIFLQTLAILKIVWNFGHQLEHVVEMRVVHIMWLLHFVCDRDWPDMAAAATAVTTVGGLCFLLGNLLSFIKRFRFLVLFSVSHPVYLINV